MFDLDTLNRKIDDLSDANLPTQEAEIKLLPILETLLGFDGLFFGNSYGWTE